MSEVSLAMPVAMLVSKLEKSSGQECLDLIDAMLEAYYRYWFNSKERRISDDEVAEFLEYGRIMDSDASESAVNAVELMVKKAYCINLHIKSTCWRTYYFEGDFFNFLKFFLESLNGALKKLL